MHLKRIMLIALLCMALGVCVKAEQMNTENEEEKKMHLRIEETEVPVTWEENESVEAIEKLCPLTIQMSMYGGFEQVGPIGQQIVRRDQQTHTSFGDIVLYSGDQIVLFWTKALRAVCSPVSAAYSSYYLYKQQERP